MTNEQKSEHNSIIMVSVTCVDPKFHVHFQDRNEAFANGFAKMFNNENQCDVTFIVEGKPLKAHRHCMSFISKKLNESFEDLAQFEPIEGKIFWIFFPTFSSISISWKQLQ